MLDSRTARETSNPRALRRRRRSRGFSISLVIDHDVTLRPAMQLAVPSHGSLFRRLFNGVCIKEDGDEREKSLVLFDRTHSNRRRFAVTAQHSKSISRALATLPPTSARHSGKDAPFQLEFARMTTVTLRKQCILSRYPKCRKAKPRSGSPSFSWAELEGPHRSTP